MSIKQSIIALSILFSASAAATATMDLMPTKGGVWVEILKDGQPVESAIVNESYFTDTFGRVFVQNHLEYSSTLTYMAVTPEGDELQKRIFLANQKNY